ncbi:MAG: hydantoinase/oxoprolinase family protein [Candidatus Bathyarchaeota archaeon]|nr:hydantoinase/oxoprolinase family protein [Candidatus Bathyarchaeota archaeon]
MDGFKIGIDVGGTFTDLILYDSKTMESRVVKVPTTPDEPESAILTGLCDLCKEPKQVSLINHATTLATNALLTHTGIGTTALITNHGFRDVLEIGRQRRPEIYNLYTKRPQPLVKRENRYTVHGRILADGTEMEPLDMQGAEQIAKTIVTEGVESVAIAFLNSYVNDSHEKSMKEILLNKKFEGLISCSSDVNREYKEYERMSTTVVNAVLSPLMSTYLRSLKSKLENTGFHAPIYVMNSDGGMNTLPYASNYPIAVIESGPAAGVFAAQHLANSLALKRVLTFDMGGTTAKAGAVIDGECDISYEFEVAGKTHSGRSIKGSGYAVRYPFIDLAEVRAGGGTIAWVDEGDALQVGPNSAGSEPGPAAYGRGGTKPTITDANIVLGRINPNHLLGGKMPIYPDRAKQAVGAIAKRLGMDLEQSAEGIIKLVNLNMAKAIMTVSVERGRDPREYTLIAFGGAGPIHCCDLAEELEVNHIIVPAHAGIFSAYGLLTANVTRTFSLPVLTTNTLLEPYFEEARKEAAKSMKEEGFHNYRLKEYVDARYKGQSFELRLPYEKSADMKRRFSEKHKEAYGYASNDEIEIVNVRVKAIINTVDAKSKRAKLNCEEEGTPTAYRDIWIKDAFSKVPVFSREKLKLGTYGMGPSIVEEYDSTLVVNSGWKWKVYDYGIELKR